jgi:hypothetical protein
LIDLLTGKIYDLSRNLQNAGLVEFTGIPLADYPYIIAEKEEVNFLSQ